MHLVNTLVAGVAALMLAGTAQAGDILTLDFDSAPTVGAGVFGSFGPATTETAAVAPIAPTNNAQTTTTNFCIDPSPLLAGCHRARSIIKPLAASRFASVFSPATPAWCSAATR